jgi:hypothetical protein
MQRRRVALAAERRRQQRAEGVIGPILFQIGGIHRPAVALKVSDTLLESVEL